MELSITLTEILLFCWAVLASAAAFKYMEDARIAKKMLVIFIEDEGTRNQILEAHKRYTDIARNHQ